MSEELKALEAEAAAVDLLNAPAGADMLGQPADNGGGNEAAEIAGLLSIIAGLFAPIFPSLTKIYTPDTVQQIGAAAAPVMAKHGWSTGTIFGRYAEELALAAVALPVAMATWQGIKADTEKAKEKQPGKPKNLEAQADWQPQDQPQVMARG